MKNVMCLTKELHFPLLVNPFLCSLQLQQKSQNSVCESPEQSLSKKQQQSFSSITADLASIPPGKCWGLRRLLWRAWLGWLACSISDRLQTYDSLQKSSSNFPPLCLWSTAHQWEEQHSSLLSPGKKDKLTIKSYSKFGAGISKWVNI